MSPAQREMAQVFAEVARALQAEEGAQATLQKAVELAVETVEGCDHAGVSIVRGKRVDTEAASDGVPGTVDQIHYQTGEGPGLEAIREQQVVRADDLTEDSRWPQFSKRAADETGVRSLLSFQLFVEADDDDTLGALNLYSRQPGAFDENAVAVGAVFAAHAALALVNAREHERAERLEQDLASSEESVRAYAQRVQVAVTLQRSMLPALPDLAPFQLAARYTPTAAAAEVGGDWYDTFPLPDGVTVLVVGDVAGHDVEAAVQMGQLRNLLRGLAVDRGEPPGDLLRRLDRIATHLQTTDTATCVYALLEQPVDAGGSPPRLRFANAGHPPPLLVTVDGTACYLPTEVHPLLGLGLDVERSVTVVDLPAGSTVLLYTDGLVEHRGRDIEDGMDQLRELAGTLAAAPVEQLCDVVMSRLAARPADDVCLLALRVPAS